MGILYCCQHCQKVKFFKNIVEVQREGWRSEIRPNNNGEPAQYIACGSCANLSETSSQG